MKFSNILKDTSLSDAIEKLKTLGNSVYDAYKSFKPKPTGDWKKKLAETAISSACQLSVNLAIEGFKKIEIIKVMANINHMIESQVERLEKTYSSEAASPSEESLDDKNKDIIEKDIDHFCKQVSDRITNEIVSFVSDVTKGAFKIASKAASSAFDGVIENKKEKFLSSNEEKKRIDDKNNNRTNIIYGEENKQNKQIKDEVMSPKKTVTKNLTENEKIISKVIMKVTADYSKQLILEYGSKWIYDTIIEKILKYLSGLIIAPVLDSKLKTELDFDSVKKNFMKLRKLKGKIKLIYISNIFISFSLFKKKFF